jgi:hypothetical protein
VAWSVQAARLGTGCTPNKWYQKSVWMLWEVKSERAERVLRLRYP